MEPLFNFHWAFMALGVMRLYHYLILQPLSFITEVNLDSMLCPAISDPFAGPWYRLAANIHQTLFIIVHGKIYCFLGNKFFAPSVTAAALATEYYNLMNKVRETYRAATSSAVADINKIPIKLVSYYDNEEESDESPLTPTNEKNGYCNQLSSSNGQHESKQQQNETTTNRQIKED